jgi:uncharacterized protein YkwD
MKNPTNLACRAFVGFLLIFESWAAFAVNQEFVPKERRLPDPLIQIICRRTPTASELFLSDVYDAQVQFISLSLTEGKQKLKLDQVKQRSTKAAIDQHQFGMSYGLCDEFSGWIALFPSPEGFKIENDRLQISKTTWASCEPNSMKVAFALEGKGRSFSIPIIQAGLATLPSQKGYVSVSCVPKVKIESGSRELALIPTGGATLTELDHVSLKVNTAEGLLAWINDKRHDDQLPPLSMSSDLEQGVKVLASNHSIEHNLKMMNSLKMDFQKRGFDLMGENRAMGATIRDVASLFWRSPKHRDVLLDPKASKVGLFVSEDKNGLFVNLITAADLAKPIAKIAP